MQTSAALKSLSWSAQPSPVGWGGGLAWPGLGPGLAWRGLAWPGLAWLNPGLAWPGLAWPGLGWPGLAWAGLASAGLCCTGSDTLLDLQSSEVALLAAPPAPRADFPLSELRFILDEDQGVSSDPVLQKAQAMVQEEMTKINIHQEQQTFLADIASRVMPHNKCLVVLEAPTSKAKVHHAWLQSKVFPEQFALFIACCNRIDLLSAMETAVQRIWPKRSTFSVMLGAERQRKGKRPSYAIWMPLVGDSWPAMVDCSGCHGKASESLRQRCDYSKCKFKKDQDDNGDA